MIQVKEPSKSQERIERVAPEVVDNWVLASVNLKYIDIAKELEMNERTVRDAIRFGIATPTTVTKLNEFFNKQAA